MPHVKDCAGLLESDAAVSAICAGTHLKHALLVLYATSTAIIESTDYEFLSGRFSHSESQVQLASSSRRRP